MQLPLICEIAIAVSLTIKLRLMNDKTFIKHSFILSNKETLRNPIGIRNNIFDFEMKCFTFEASLCFIAEYLSIQKEKLGRSKKVREKKNRS